MPKTSATRLRQRRLMMTPHSWTSDQEARRMAVERGETVVANWKVDVALNAGPSNAGCSSISAVGCLSLA